MVQEFNKTIMVVEDEENIASIIKSSLEAAGFKVVTALMSDQAYQYLKDVDHVDGVWLDHYLLGLSGLDFVKKIRADNEWQHLPIFVISNSEDEEMKKEYLQLGIINYYTKADNELGSIVKEVAKYFKDVK